MRAQALKPLLKRLLRIGGWALSLLAIAFFVRLILRNGMAVPGHGAWEIIGVSTVSAVLYGLAVVLLGWLWTLLIVPDGGTDLVRPIAASYMKSQFAKYLPGNVFQYAARHALGRRLGIDHGQLAAAAVVEAGMLVGAAAFIVMLLGTPVLLTLFPAAPVLPWPLAFIFPLALAATTAAPRPGFPFLLRIPRYRFSRVLLGFTGYVLFFCIFGGLFQGLLAWCTGTQPDPLRVVPTSALAWLAGFFVPGAPAGAGLRETALALAAGDGKSSQATLAAIMLFRIATMGGDFLAFLLGSLLSRNHPKPE